VLPDEIAGNIARRSVGQRAHPDISRSREEIPVELMERAGEDSIRRVERLLDSVSVVDVDVDVEHSGVDTEQFEDAENDVVDVAEPWMKAEDV
jgi:hypothetical protein